MTNNSDATYLVHLPDDSELGPASVDDLRAWAEAGVVTETTAVSVVGLKVRTLAASKGAFVWDLAVMKWLVPIMFGLYCWLRQTSITQVGRA